MDEFDIDEIFGKNENAVPLEEDAQSDTPVAAEPPQDEFEPQFVDVSSTTAQDVPEAVQEPAPEIFAPDEKTEEYTAQEYAPQEAEPESKVFQFDENGEYHYTAPVPDGYKPAEQVKEDFAKEEPEAKEHTSDEQSFRQNPYRTSYYQQNNPYRQQNRGCSSQDRGGYQRPDCSNGYEEPKKPTKGSSAGKKIVAAILAMVIILGSVGIGISIGRSKTDSPSSNTTAAEKTTNDSATIAIESTEPSSAQDVTSVSPGILVAKKARGSVVGVAVYDASGSLYGEGSGVVMGLNDAKDKTFVITCAHVISDAEIKSCGILLSDGKISQAKIIGYDERTDIGVLSVDRTDLEVASFGDSSTLQVGETVYAIGNPGGSEFYGSMTSGIVSALDRSISSTYTMTVIQHNAAISPGNSGGALVNSDGQVIGINSSKISATDYEGIGFAVPISVARPVVENIISYGYVPNRPKLGISYASVSNYWRYSAIVQSKGLPSGSVIIADIAEDSSFKGTEVAVGDMITSVNGKDLTKSDILLDIIDKSKVGDSLKLGICRIERSSGVGGSYKINQFEVTVKLVEDKGSTSATADKEEETTQSFYDYYYGNGNGDNYNNFEDFFSQFFGNGF